MKTIYIYLLVLLAACGTSSTSADQSQPVTPTPTGPTQAQRAAGDAQRAARSRELKAQADAESKDEIRAGVTTTVSFNRRVIGGVTSVVVTACNRSGYNLAYLDVHLKYLLAQGPVYKTEIVTIKNLGGNECLTVAGPNSAKGMAMQVEPIQAESNGIEGCIVFMGGWDRPGPCTR